MFRRSGGLPGEGLPRVPDGARLSLEVYLGPRNQRTEAFGLEGGSYKVRQFFFAGMCRTAGLPRGGRRDTGLQGTVGSRGVACDRGNGGTE